MRFDGISSVPDGQPLDRTGQAGSSSRKGGAEQAKAASDEMQLSAGRSTVEDLKAGLTHLPAVRQDRVEALQKALQDGSFHVTDQQLADAIMGDFFAPGTAAKK